MQSQYTVLNKMIYDNYTVPLIVLNNFAHFKAK